MHFCFTDIFLNINCLLRIACTIPVTSADNKREKGAALKLVKGYLHTTMTTERLLGLAMMNILYEKPIDYDAVVQFFAERYQRMLLVDPMFHETQN